MTRSKLLEVVPPGTVICYGASTAPLGWLSCNGDSYSTTSYESLFEKIGYTFGGSGSSFQVPDLRDMFVRSAPTSSEVGTRQNDAIKNHPHTTVNDSGSSEQFILNYSEQIGILADTTSGDLLNKPSRSTIDLETDINNLDTNTFDENETYPINIALHYIIKY